MSDDRLAQARDEATRRYPPWDGPDLTYPAHQVGKHIASAFVSGVVWADANPQPRTITRAQFEEAFEARFMPDSVTGMNVLGFLREVGVEVRDE